MNANRSSEFTVGSCGSPTATAPAVDPSPLAVKSDLKGLKVEFKSELDIMGRDEISDVVYQATVAAIKTYAERAVIKYDDCWSCEPVENNILVTVGRRVDVMNVCGGTLYIDGQKWHIDIQIKTLVTADIGEAEAKVTDLYTEVDDE